MGIKATGSFHPINMAEGVKTRNEMKIPFCAPFNLLLVLAIRYPETTQSENADKFASQGNF